MYEIKYIYLNCTTEFIRINTQLEVPTKTKSLSSFLPNVV